MQFFAPAYDDDDDAVAASVYIMIYAIYGKEPSDQQVFEDYKSKCHLVYTKDGGLIG